MPPSRYTSKVDLGEAPDGDRTVVLFGNSNPQTQVEVRTKQPDGSTQVSTISVPAEHINQSVTTVDLWPGFDDPEQVAHTLSTDNDRMLLLIAKSLAADDKHYTVGVSEMEQLVGIHTPGVKPDWIASSDPDLQRVLCEHFDCPAGEPVALLLTVGRDALHAQHMSISAQPAAFNYLALTANSTAPAVGNTSLAGEIATGGGGLIRAQATYAHTAGTNTSTLTKTFTANGSDVLPVVVAKIGVFNASSTGTEGYETLLNVTSTLTTSGDNVTVTETVTGG